MGVSYSNQPGQLRVCTKEPESNTDSRVCAGKGTTDTGAETFPDGIMFLLGGKRCSILGCCERHSVVACGG